VAFPLRMDGGEAGAAQEAGHPVQDGPWRQAGSRPREEDADAIYQKLARTHRIEGAGAEGRGAAVSAGGSS
jgi:hypothetical protein